MLRVTNICWFIYTFLLYQLTVAFRGATMEMKEVLGREGRDAKNLLVYQIRDDKPLALGANYDSKFVKGVITFSRQ